MCFVGFRQTSENELRDLLEQFKHGRTYYFLRWAHNVSGILGALPTNGFPSLEGQLFNNQLELRWKYRKADVYEVLLLSKNLVNRTDFTQIPVDWETCDRSAYCYEKDETRFSKGFIYQNEQGNAIDPKKLLIQQRYFKDKNTGTVHFIALTTN